MSKKLPLIISFSFLLMTFSSFSQDSVIRTPTFSERKAMKVRLKREAIIQINDLKNRGALLIRLQTRQASIDKLRELGNREAAQEMELEQRRYNLKIIENFNTYFNFCPVYFFFSDQSVLIREKRFDEAEFVDENLQTAKTPNLEGLRIFIGEYGLTDPDPYVYSSDYKIESGENGPVKQQVYYGGANFRLFAVVLYDDQFIQLRDPFPFYAKANGSPKSLKNLHVGVFKINKYLHEFYDKYGNY